MLSDIQSDLGLVSVVVSIEVSGVRSGQVVVLKGNIEGFAIYI